MSTNKEILKHQKQIDKLLMSLLGITEKEILVFYRNSSKKVDSLIRRLYNGFPELTAEEIEKGGLLAQSKVDSKLTKTLNRIKKETMELAGLTNDRIEPSILRSFSGAYYGEAWSYEDVTSLDFKFTRLKTNFVEKFKFSNKYKPTWRTRNNRNTGKMFNKIESSLIEGLNKGQSVAVTARNIKDIFVKLEVVNKKTMVSGGYTEARRIARTETNRLLNLGRTQAYKHARRTGKKIGVRFQRIMDAVLDKRTRPQSAQMDGQVADAKGFFTYPGGLLSDTPGNTGVAAFDIQDRETTRQEMINDNGTPVIERPQDLTFREYANLKGFTKNKFGQDLFKPLDFNKK